ncbi:N-acetyltransferase family protein [Anaerotaenia torta]|uniref:GNAT family N-acetyltransferase n=1 Tax=Anaerotaenia torta TaxID=433293 RepID=UPI003D1A76BD
MVLLSENTRDLILYIKQANEQDIDNLINMFPGIKPVLCTGKDGYTLIAMDYDRPIAFASVFRREIPAPLHGKTEDFINVIDVVDPSCRKKGIGSAFINEVKRIASEAGSMQIRAYCDINNEASHALWAKNNFGISPVKNTDGTILGSFVTYRL